MPPYTERFKHKHFYSEKRTKPNVTATCSQLFMTPPDRSFRKYIVDFFLSLFSTVPPFLRSTHLKTKRRSVKNKNINHFIIQDISFAEVARVGSNYTTVNDGNAAVLNTELQQNCNIETIAFQIVLRLNFCRLSFFLLTDRWLKLF
jgi:hypothetical protein